MLEDFWSKYVPHYYTGALITISESTIPPELFPQIRQRNRLVEEKDRICSTCDGFGKLFFTNNSTMSWKCMECGGDGRARKG